MSRIRIARQIAVIGLLSFGWMSSPAAAQGHSHPASGQGAHGSQSAAGSQSAQPPAKPTDPDPPEPAGAAAPDHSMHQQHKSPPAPESPASPSPASQPASPTQAQPPGQQQPPPKSDGSARREAGLPPVTDEDRAAAFPDVKGHHVHDNAVNYFVLFDQLEWQSGDGGAGSWDTKGWVGRDKDRLWFRTEGEVENGDVQDAEAHLLYGRAISRWWDVVAGVRQDMRPGSARTWGAIGLQGLAPYWFEVEATAYIGESGQTAARLEAEYELLLTNRLILQPLVEANFYSKSSPERGIGAGLSSTEAGLRLRYEFRREFAPYIGLTWDRKYGRTADLARQAGDDVSSARFLVGLRLWF